MRELPDPVLTYERYDKWLDAHDIQDAAEQRKALKELIHSLPPPNRIFLSMIIPLLARIAMNSSINKVKNVISSLRIHSKVICQLAD